MKATKDTQFQKEILAYFKGKNIQEADKLLIETAQNNFNVGYEKARSEILKHKRDVKGEICCDGCFQIGYNKAKKEVLEFIEKKRKGNYVEGSAFPDLFDPAFCLSDLIKFLKGEK